MINNSNKQNIKLSNDDFVPSKKYKGKWSSEYFENQNPLVLDLGCGYGDYIMALAELYPDKNFLGLDADKTQIWRGAKKVFEKKILNASFVPIDIKFLNDYFDNNEITEIWINFPDTKNLETGLISTDNLNTYFRLLIPNGILHFKTDDYDFFENAYKSFEANGFTAIKKIADIHNADDNNYQIKLKSAKELESIDQGKSIHYFSFTCYK